MRLRTPVTYNTLKQSWSQKKSTCTCDEVRANPQGILLFWGEPLLRQSNPWLGHKRGHKQVRRPTCSVAQYWIHRIGLLLMIEFYRILEVWMDTFWGKRRHLYLSFEKDTAGDAWEWDYFMPPPIFFDARDLVYQMKEPRSKSIQKNSVFGGAWTILWTLKSEKFGNLVIL